MPIELKKGLCSICNDGKIKPIARKRDMLCHFHLSQAYQNKANKKAIEKRNSEPVKKTTIKNRSKKRSKQEQEYHKKRKVFLANPKNLLCNAKAPGCTKIAKVIHHKKGRIGNLLTDEKYWLATCSHCNMWIEENSQQAREMGLTLNRYTKK
jgi:hypothetical protein